MIVVATDGPVDAQTMYRCAAGCDFDYCEHCFNIAYQRKQNNFDKVSPVLKKMAHSDCLLKTVRNLRTNLVSIETHGWAPEDPFKFSRSEEDMHTELWSWLLFLEASLKVPGFPQYFIRRRACVKVLLHILSTGTTKLNNVNELLIDPSAILVAALADRIVAFKEQQTGTNMDDAESLPSAFVKACVNSNVVDHLLLRVGHLQGETSRNLDWAENYEKPPVLIAQSDMSFSGISNKALSL